MAKSGAKGSRSGRGRRRGRGGQVRFDFPHGHGGRRRGAGRKPKGERAGVSHSTRERVLERHPVHVTVRVGRQLPSLRRQRTKRVLWRAFGAGRDRFGFRLIEFSVQSNHIHMIAEATDARALSRGMQGLLVRIARALNRLWGRRGTVFPDRYHARGLRTPREVWEALRYVLNNALRHGIRGLRGPDPFSSGPWFEAWRRRVRHVTYEIDRGTVMRARCWLLLRGWKRHGPLSWSAHPGG